MKRFISTLVSVGAFSLLGGTGFSDVDLSPRVVDGKVVSGGYSHDGPAFDLPPSIKVFDYVFGEEPTTPYFITDPGFAIHKPASGTEGWDNGKKISFDIVSSLQYWNGSGSPTLTAPASTDFLQWNLGATTRTITGSSGAQAGFLIDTTNTTGIVGSDIIHKHISSFLWGASGTTVNFGDSGFVPPADGLYAFQIELSTDQAAVLKSDPLWIVYSNNVNGGLGSEEEGAARTEEFVDFLNASAVPEPASLAILGAGALALFVKRRPNARQNA